MTVAALGGYLAFLQLSGNFHTVIDGELYRSAQPSAGQLETYVRDHGIRTVINLRGESVTAHWYADEIATAKRLNLNHIDFRMNASRRLTTGEADELVAILKAAPKPILIHCKAGADRTGLVSVIYSERIAGMSEEIAENQLSIRFGHIGLPFLSSTFAMDESWETLERHFGIEG
ncbi:dual specificity protein phosphatase family protein [Rhizobium sp. LjRoot30]|uniref:dual specificity protein phosphatase family protein n=1 Tax=Rhizobium sp. LjRoot30 TaxID=3342320 RepID=UPI003ECE890E